MSIVRAPKVNPDGTIGIQGWRALCSCLYLGPVQSYSGAEKHLQRHKKNCEYHKAHKK